MSRIYRNVVHDGRDPFEMERQLFLLAKAGAQVHKEWVKSQMTVKAPGEEPTLFECYMRELYQQLDKTDIFMGGFHSRITTTD